MAALRIPALACSALALALLVAGPAAAAGQASALTMTTAEGEQAVPPGKVATLTCDPTGGTHKHRTQACAELTQADGQVSKLAGDPNSQLCTMDYRPVTVTLRGIWRDRPVDFTQTYGNPCALRGATGVVFAL